MSWLICIMIKGYRNILGIPCIYFMLGCWDTHNNLKRIERTYKNEKQQARFYLVLSGILPEPNITEGPESQIKSTLYIEIRGEVLPTPHGT